jgi:trehalose-6-phosphate synthase
MRNHKQRFLIAIEHTQVVTVNCDPDLFEMYYNGCCNGTHWPLFHSMPGEFRVVS